MNYKKIKCVDCGTYIFWSETRRSFGVVANAPNLDAQRHPKYRAVFAAPCGT